MIDSNSKVHILKKKEESSQNESMAEQTQALSLDFGMESEELISNQKSTWGRLISLNSNYQNIELSGE